MNTVTIPFEPQGLPAFDPARRQTVIGAVGNTPLIELRSLTRDIPGVKLLAKCEWFNPGGSVKDRPALNMLLDGERRGLLRPGKTILDATSGNTGIAYAMLAASRGYRVTLCMPASVTDERVRTLRAFGAEIILTSAMEGSDGAIREARRLHEAHPDRYFYADQYNNDANWRAHYTTTGPEILEQTRGRITHFVAGLGTSGTFMGVGRRLREHSSRIRLISVQPDSAVHAIEGLKDMDTAIVPGIYDGGLADENLRVSTEDAWELTRRLAREEGLLVGVSSGAALAAALHVASRLTDGVIVTVFPDSGTRYLSEPFWEGVR